MALKRKYGAFGTIGPARGFKWSEVRCTDGTLNTRRYMRRRYRRSGVLLNRLRRAIKRDHPDARVSIVVNSWYRSPSYNASIGGAQFSQHVAGRATDIKVYIVKDGKSRQLTPEAVASYAKRVKAFERGGIGTYSRARGYFTHCDFRPDGPARWHES